jgi:NADPH-dependent glutamate synthase beta subunit-like oxidoreductase
VAVIGGGNTAVDVARIALRLGATDVSLIYRRSEAEMRACPHEVADARAEGVHFEWLPVSEPVRFLREDRLYRARMPAHAVCRALGYSAFSLVLIPDVRFVACWFHESHGRSV